MQLELSPPDLTKETIHAQVVKLLVETFELDAQDVQPQSNLYTDLGIDSIDAIDLLVNLQRTTGKRIKPEAFKAVRTVQDVVDVIAALANE